MFQSLARIAVRWHRYVLAAVVLVAIGAGVLAAGVSDRLAQGGFEDPAAESATAREVLTDQFGAGPPNLILLVTPVEGDLDDRAVVEAGLALTRAVGEEDGVAEAGSYWSAGSDRDLRSSDGERALVFARVSGSDDDVQEVMDRLGPRYVGQTLNGFDIEVGGEAEVFREVQDRIEHDLLLAEAIAIPLTLLALVLVFRSLVAAALPVAIGVFSVLGTLAFLRLLTEFVPVSIFSLNVTTALGLGLAIDYSLFILSRYRESLDHGQDAEQALTTAVTTAGRTVAYSSMIVALSLSAMLVFPQHVLRSFAYAGIGVTLFAAAGALVILPALVAALGPHRVNALDLRRPLARLFGRTASTSRSGEARGWARMARTVMRRPFVLGAAVITLLVLLGTPFLRADFAQPDDRVLPPDEPASAVHKSLRSDFPNSDFATISVVASTVPQSPRRTADTNDYAAALSGLKSVKRVEAATGVYAQGRRVGATPGGMRAQFEAESGTYMSVVPSVAPLSDEAERLVEDIRAEPAPYPVMVAGDSAELADTVASLSDRLPWSLGIITTATLVFLFLFTGSVLLPLKAVVLNLLSLSAAFGAMVYVFQEGHLRWLVGDFTPTGTLDVTSPILMFCVLFGLSMDYEIFLLSRIKEEWEATGDNQAAVAFGLQRTGGLITAAASLLVIVFLGIATSGISFIKMLGIGTALAIIVDATLIRGVLVPAFMQIAGKANWWAPRPLRRLHSRIGLSESATSVPQPARAGAGSG